MPTGVPSFPASECRPAARRDSLGTLCWLPTVALERQPCCKFYTSRIADCGGLPERRIRGRSGNGACSKCPVRNHIVPMIEGVEGFCHTLQTHSLGQRKDSAETCVEIEEVEADTCVTADDRAGNSFRTGIDGCSAGTCRRNDTISGTCSAGTLRRLLGCVSACRDIEGQAGVVLQNGAQSPSMRQMVGEAIRRLYRGGQHRIEHHAMTLIVIRAAAITTEVRVVDRRTEEEFTDVINRMRPGVGDTRRSPRRRPLLKTNFQPIEVRIKDRAVRLDIATGRVRSCSVEIGVGVVRADQMLPSHMLIAQTKGALR